MTLFTSKEHMCRAALESTAFQAVDIMEASGISGDALFRNSGSGTEGQGFETLVSRVRG